MYILAKATCLKARWGIQDE